MGWSAVDSMKAKNAIQSDPRMMFQFICGAVGPGRLKRHWTPSNARGSSAKRTEPSGSRFPGFWWKSGSWCHNAFCSLIAVTLRIVCSGLQKPPGVQFSSNNLECAGRAQASLFVSMKRVGYLALLWHSSPLRLSSSCTFARRKCRPSGITAQETHEGEFSSLQPLIG